MTPVAQVHAALDATGPIAPASVGMPLMSKMLKARCEHFKAPLPPFHPVFDRIFVYPLKDKEQPEKSPGGIYLAPRTRERVGAGRGLLMAAGPKAVEQLYGHGIGVGHIVIVARLSMWERSYFADKVEHTVLVLRASEVVASEDLMTAYEKGDLWMEMQPATGEVTWADRESGSRVRSDPEDQYENI